MVVKDRAARYCPTSAWLVPRSSRRSSRSRRPLFRSPEGRRTSAARGVAPATTSTSPSASGAPAAARGRRRAEAASGARRPSARPRRAWASTRAAGRCAPTGAGATTGTSRWGAPRTRRPPAGWARAAPRTAPRSASVRRTPCPPRETDGSPSATRPSTSGTSRVQSVARARWWCASTSALAPRQLLRPLRLRLPRRRPRPPRLLPRRPLRRGRLL